MNYGELTRNNKIRVAFIAVLLATAILGFKGINYGIEFIGGVRIPVSLEKAVDAQTMDSIVETLKARVNTFGLKQAVVRPLGNTEIIVEIPRAEPEAIKHIEDILREQGHFEAIIDGKQALDGSYIIQNAVGGAQAEFVEARNDGGATWEIHFAITGEGQERFAEVASGKFGYPVLMFLDRPENAVIVAPRSLVVGEQGNEALLQEALSKEGDDIKLVYYSEFEVEGIGNKTTAIVPASLAIDEPEIYSALLGAGFEEVQSLGEAPEKRLVVKSEEELTPRYFNSGTGGVFLSEWEAIGLMSAPTLQTEPIKQKQITSYSITGSVPASESAELDAANEIRLIKSVLSGGRLPVSTTIGSYYNVAPQLGEQFTYYSFIAIGIAVLAVTAVIVFRYRKIILIIPIIVVNSFEILLTLTIIGAFGTLDLSAMAGIIALIGTGVDDQLIITDEMLCGRKEEETTRRDAKERVARAFYVVLTAAGIAVASMLPLLLSGIVEITGFALSTIIGVTIGVLVTRPAYGAFMEVMFGTTN